MLYIRHKMAASSASSNSDKLATTSASTNRRSRSKTRSLHISIKIKSLLVNFCVVGNKSSDTGKFCNSLNVVIIEEAGDTSN
jgi:hypothetical protein